jgi:hypothetical protein
VAITGPWDLREHWYELEYRRFEFNDLPQKPVAVERDNNHGFATGVGTQREKSALWAHDCLLDWCDRANQQRGRWDVILYRLDDQQLRLHEMAHIRLTVRIINSQPRCGAPCAFCGRGGNNG